jgi:hypothetical protein
VKVPASLVRIVLFAGIVACTGAPAMAQDEVLVRFARVYLTGGWIESWRQPAWAPAHATPSPPPASPVPSLTVGGGVWLRSGVGVEGTIGFQRQQTFPWHYGYLFDRNSDELATDRDVPLVGVLRLAPARGEPVSVEAIAGGGISWHRGESFTTADCGPGSRPMPCVPVTPTLSDSVTTAEWMATFGADVVFRLSWRVAITPGFRIDLVRRRQYLTGYDHRGPYSGGGVMPAFSITARYTIR